MPSGYTRSPISPTDLGTGWELVIGHSLGGVVAAHAAAHDPGFAQRLILLDPVLEIADEDFPRSARASSTRPATRPRRRQVRAENPGWDAEIVRAKALASRQAHPDAVRADAQRERAVAPRAAAGPRDACRR